MARGVVKKFRERREARRAKRAANKADEANRRSLADQQMQQALGTYDEARANLPNEAAQQGVNQSLWNQGSRQAQVDTSQLQEIANQGYSAADEASLQAAQNQANQSAAANRQAAMQQAASRGQAGGGLAMMAALQANQGAANANQATAAGIAQNRIQARQQGANNLFAARTGQGQAVDQFNQNMAQNQRDISQQNFGNQANLAQAQSAQLGANAAYNQQTADQKRQRRLSFLNFLSNPMGGVS